MSSLLSPRPARAAALAAAALLLLAAVPPLARAQTAASIAAQQSPAARAPQPGDCGIFREGGNGRLLKTPTWWLRGTLTEVRRETRRADVCPRFDRPPQSFTPADWARLAAALPCVSSPDAVREVEVWRVTLRADAWETPWTHAHGDNGWLFRGQFLEQPLRAGALIEMDASWLERCEE